MWYLLGAKGVSFFTPYTTINRTRYRNVSQSNSKQFVPDTGVRS